MTKQISIDVSDLHAEMYDEVTDAAGDEQVRQQMETLIHQLYQQVEQARNQQQLQISEPEDRE